MGHNGPCGYSFCGDCYPRSPKMDDFKNGKRFVAANIRAEIDWIQKGIDGGIVTDPSKILAFIKAKLEDYSK